MNNNPPFNQPVLLISNDYGAINFIKINKALNLIYKGKVDVIEVWEGEFLTSEKLSWPYPAVVKLNYHTKQHFNKVNFNRRSVLQRDNYLCSYCGCELTNNNATIDHIIPASRFNKNLSYSVNSFINCCASCKKCNAYKGNKLLSEVNMKLLITPKIPQNHLFLFANSHRFKFHPAWKNVKEGFYIA